jgi:hypothetical protein
MLNKTLGLNRSVEPRKNNGPREREERTGFCACKTQSPCGTEKKELACGNKHEEMICGISKMEYT